MTYSTFSVTARDIRKGWYMLRKVAALLLAPAAILFTRGSPVIISPIRSNEGFYRNMTTTYRDVIEISCKCNISSYFLRYEIDSFLHQLIAM